MSNKSKSGDFNLDEELRNKIAANEEGQPLSDDHEDEIHNEDDDAVKTLSVEEKFRFKKHKALKIAKYLLDQELANLDKKFEEESKGLDTEKVSELKEAYAAKKQNVVAESSYTQKLKTVEEAKKQYKETLVSLKAKKKEEIHEVPSANNEETKKSIISKYKRLAIEAKEAYQEVRRQELEGELTPEEIYGINPRIKRKDSLINSDVLLSVRNLKQFFFFGSGLNKSKLKAVSNVSFDVKSGECFGIVGESGCGKTTTGRSIIKLYDITSGSVYYKGYRISAGDRWNRKEIKFTKIRLTQKLKQLAADKAKELKECDNSKEKIAEINARYDKEVIEAKANAAEIIKVQKEKIKQIKFDNAHTPRKLLNEIQMIFQDPIDSLDPRMTVEDIIQEGLQIQGHKNKAQNHERVVEMLEKVGLVSEHASRYPHEFSGGQRQRIGIARALIMNPKLLICDEPISALDVSIRAQIINLLNELKEELGLTIIFIAHDLSVVKYFCDRIAVMYFGKVVELTTSEELFKHPLHPYTKSLLSAIPKPDPIIEKTRERIIYKPQEVHDYSVDKPEMREITQGHFIYCNKAEFEQYKKQLEEEK